MLDQTHTCGILVINKEVGYTSFDVVAKLRRILQIKKIGHTGTLDPMATGVLPVCIGKATKVVDLLTDMDKTYLTTMLLGKSTDTQDKTGTVLLEREVPEDIQRIKEAIYSFEGESMQLPPMFSAKKVQGRRLYELAREGKTVERRPCRICVRSIKILSTEQLENLPRVDLEIRCSKGTYIRTILNDIGEKLGCGALMESLIRTEVGPFNLANALLLSDVERLVEEGELEQYLIPVDRLFPHLRRYVVTESGVRFLKNGNALRPEQLRMVEPAGTDGLGGSRGACGSDRALSGSGRACGSDNALSGSGRACGSDSSGDPGGSDNVPGAQGLMPGERILVYLPGQADAKGDFAAVYQCMDEAGICKPVQMFL